MAGERGAVLLTDLIVAARHAGQVKQYCEPCRALHQGADRRAAQSYDEIPLPVARHCPVGRFRRALADHDLRGEVGFAASAAARPRHAQCPPGPQAGGQLAPQRAAALHVQCLVDGLVADAHRLIAGEVEPQPPGDLLRAPRPGPLPVLPCPCRRPFQGTTGPQTAAPPEVATTPASRSCTYVCSAALATSFAGFGWRAARSACHCAAVAR